ncbi:MAG: ABC transporter permease, partial [Candidatus Saliniplasma sp.]
GMVMEGGFATYIVVGIITWRFIRVGFFDSSWSIRWEQHIGTFKNIYMIPHHLLVPVSATALSGFTVSLLNFVEMWLVAEFVFGISLNLTIPSFLFLVLAWMSVIGFGFAIAGIAVLYKEIQAVFTVIFFSFQFFCGVFFPVSSLPRAAQYISRAIPITYALNGMRTSMNRGYIPMNDVLIMVVAGVIGMFIGLITLHLCLKKALKDGKLERY